jgi:hypothetical protein
MYDLYHKFLQEQSSRLIDSRLFNEFFQIALRWFGQMRTTAYSVWTIFDGEQIL